MCAQPEAQRMNVLHRLALEEEDYINMCKDEALIILVVRAFCGFRLQHNDFIDLQTMKQDRKISLLKECNWSKAQHAATSQTVTANHIYELTSDTQSHN